MNSWPVREKSERTTAITIASPRNKRRLQLRHDSAAVTHEQNALKFTPATHMRRNEKKKTLRPAGSAPVPTAVTAANLALRPGVALLGRPTPREEAPETGHGRQT